MLDNRAMKNFTDHANRFEEYPDDIREHTNVISLSIILLFGIVFVVTVLYLTGRRWVESFKEGHTKGYTRISHLLNDN